AENAHGSARHVLAAVVSRALDDGDRARIAHGKALACDTGRKKIPAGRAVQAGVAHDDSLILCIPCIARVAQNDLAARHALADIVVGVTLEMQVQAAGVPHTKALPDIACQAHGQRRILHPIVTPAPRNLPGHAGANRAVEVANLVTPLATLPAL